MASQSTEDEVQKHSRSSRQPYSEHHPVPTISRYEKIQQSRRQQEDAEGAEDNDISRYPGQPSGQQDLDDQAIEDSQSTSFLKKVKTKLGVSNEANPPGKEPYESGNRNVEEPEKAARLDSREGYPVGGTAKGYTQHNESSARESHKQAKDDGNTQDTTESMGPGGNIKDQRKAVKKRKPHGKVRVVTDPVTHLPVSIHDFTDKELKSSPENLPEPGSKHDTAFGPAGANKSETELHEETLSIEKGGRAMRRLFPPPEVQEIRKEIDRLYNKTFLSASAALVVAFLAAGTLAYTSPTFSFVGVSSGLFVGIVIAGAIVIVVLLPKWASNKLEKLLDQEVWQAASDREKEEVEANVPESVQWMNSLVASIWPLINPDLFTSISDTIEDVMQASLPRFIRMVAVDDIGQGSEAIRILGIRWLPTGAAAKSVSEDGKLEKNDQENSNNDRATDGQGQIEDGSDSKDSDNPKNQNDNNDESQTVTEGLEKEEGEFVNMELAFSYKATSRSKRISQKAKHAHMYIVFYLPGSIPVPVWVSLDGIVGIVRMRLQLTPDPPFVALCTVSLMGQPRVDASAVPLAKHFFNVMDLPFLSNFVQSAIDAAVAEYVAPKSMTLNIKEMLMGDDFKINTTARGVIFITIKKAYDFIVADVSLGGLKRGSTDPYVSVGWAKFGKPLWSTRVMLKEMHPNWYESTWMLVTPQETDAGESLRVQLWDSDRMSADDDCGRIEIPLKELMQNENSQEKMWDRKDNFVALDSDDQMPGTLEWSVGFFRRKRITQEQIDTSANVPKGVKSVQDLRDMTEKESKRKLREASDRGIVEEIEQQKDQDLVLKEHQIIAAAPPSKDFPTGILSIQIHNITGLELQLLSKDRDETKNDATEGTETSDDLPSSYATIIINHKKVFKTRVKPKNTQPFFNAVTERVLSDWQSTQVIVSVRDARVHENDALIGFVLLDLKKVFKERCQTNNTYPLIGGIGFGRVRISLVFRAVGLQVPRELLGWDYGALHIKKITSEGLPEELQKMRVKVKNSLNRHRLWRQEDGTWERRRHGPIDLGVRNRYSSPITIEFRASKLGPDRTSAYGTFWLKDIADKEDKTVKISIYQNTKEVDLKRAKSNIVDAKDMGEKLGEMTFEMRFEPGLGYYHRKYSRRNVNLQDVMEVLDAAKDNHGLIKSMQGTDGKDPDENESAASSDDEGEEEEDTDNDDDDDNDAPPNGNVKRSETQEDSANPFQQIKDFRSNMKTLHRQEKGLMQWKGPRTAKWMKRKLDTTTSKLASIVGHHERESGIETEA